MAEYIGREAVCREICADNTMSGYEKAYCCELIRNIPAADVAPVVHGRWEWMGPYRYTNDGMIATCSVCKERLRLFAHNYCPNCGARMDLEVMDNGQK